MVLPPSSWWQAKPRWGFALDGSNPSLQNKKAHSIEWTFYLVDLRRFELPTPNALPAALQAHGVLCNYTAAGNCCQEELAQNMSGMLYFMQRKD